MRGHFEEDCPGESPDALQESLRVFEEYAGQHSVARNWMRNPYLDPHFFPLKCFDQVRTCPFKCEDIMKVSAADFKQAMRNWRDSQKGKGKGKDKKTK